MTSSSPPSYTSSRADSTDHGHGGNVDSEDRRSIQKTSPKPAHREISVDNLRLIAGDKFRRSTYGPDFLKQIAGKGLPDGGDKDAGAKFKVITGPQARTIYENFLGERSLSDASSREEGKRPKKRTPPPVVFAFTAIDAGSKVVDYYMTWRGKTKARHLKGSERKFGFLDTEFKRLTKALDEEYKRLSLVGPSGVERSPTNTVRPLDPPESSAVPEAPVPPTPADPQPADLPPANDLDPSRLSASSVVSLPLLNMVRGVPLGNRVPLFVTNPDTASLTSSTVSIRGSITETNLSRASTAQSQAFNTQSEIPAESNATANSSPTSSQEQDSPSTPISENRTKKSKSSKSPIDKLSPLITRTSSATSSGHESTKSSTDTKESSSEILIVVLDDKKDHTWHGLERQLSRRKTTSSKHSGHNGRNSPWSGPLVPADGIKYRSPRKRPSQSDDSSSDEEEWKDAPVIPMKAYLVSEGLIPPDGPGPILESPVTSSHLQVMLASGHGYAYSPYVSDSGQFSPQPAYPRAPYPTYPISSPYAPHVTSPLQHVSNMPPTHPMPWMSPAAYSGSYMSGYLPPY